MHDQRRMIGYWLRRILRRFYFCAIGKIVIELSDIKSPVAALRFGGSEYTVVYHPINGRNAHTNMLGRSFS